MRRFTFRSGERVKEIALERRSLTFLYQEAEALVFMGPRDFEQYRIPSRVIGDAARFLLVGQETTVLFWDEDPLDVEVPTKAILSVKEASPGVKGDTVSGATKDAILENGLRLRVPLFIKAGDRVVVDTRTGEYVERSS